MKYSLEKNIQATLSSKSNENMIGMREKEKSFGSLKIINRRKRTIFMNTFIFRVKSNNGESKMVYYTKAATRPSKQREIQAEQSRKLLQKHERSVMEQVKNEYTEGIPLQQSLTPLFYYNLPVISFINAQNYEIYDQSQMNAF